MKTETQVVRAAFVSVQEAAVRGEPAADPPDKDGLCRRPRF